MGVSVIPLMEIGNLPAILKSHWKDTIRSPLEVAAARADDGIAEDTTAVHAAAAPNRWRRETCGEIS